jgi:GGDEF domain-containing protein
VKRANQADAPTDGVCGAALKECPTPRAVYATAPVRTGEDHTRQLLCDPLTGLVAYPSFAEYLTECLPALVRYGLHLAIGDVDDLREYVSRQRAENPTMFGHLAGNECMRRLGAITADWANRTLSSWPFFLCGTFGGDEVIVAAAGGPYQIFLDEVAALQRAVTAGAPRTCSFSTGTLRTDGLRPGGGGDAYREFVSQVDRALFSRKADLRSNGIRPRSDLVDVGAVPITTASDEAGPEPHNRDATTPIGGTA